MRSDASVLQAAKRQAGNFSSGQLRRRIGLLLLVLYGVGVTVGAGIYVLIGSVAGHAGINSPLAFGIAAIVMGLTVASYAELCTRFPVAAGEAAYVRAAFGSRVLSTITGGLMIATAVIASAAVTLGSVGYLAQFSNLPKELLIVVVIGGVSIVVAWGVLESVLLASLFTLIEVGGLVAIIVAAAWAGLPIGDALLAPPPADLATVSGLLFASMLAFFAFIGFEDLTNMVEESHSPTRNVPLAMALTLIITTALYVLVAAIAVTAVPLEKLASSEAPLTIVFQNVAGMGATIISAIAIGATLNTVIAQMTMASRVIYGMARQGDLPSVLGAVHSTRGTPLVATVAISLLVLALALFIPFGRLAEFTSIATLIVFALVNASLLRLRLQRKNSTPGKIRVPIWVPLFGFISCIMMIGSSFL
jgi:APA family basic amino acid/polyamine antiporter